MTLDEVDDFYFEKNIQNQSSKEKYLTYKKTHMSIDSKSNYTSDAEVKLSSGFGAAIHSLYSYPNYHTHSFIEMMYIINGCFTNVIEGEEYVMNRGDICFLPPGVFHSVDSVGDYPEKCVLLNIFISVESAPEVLNLLLNGTQLSVFFKDIIYGAKHRKYAFLKCIESGNTDMLIRLFHISYMDTCGRNCNNHNPITFYGASGTHCIPESEMLLTKMLLCSTILSALISGSHVLNISPNTVKSAVPATKILQYIKVNYSTVSLDDVSKKFNYSFAYTSRLIKQLTGISFTKLLREIRIENACRLLQSSELPVQEIAAQTGYGSIEHFHRTFKAEKGISPAEFRKMQGMDKQSQHTEP